MKRSRLIPLAFAFVALLRLSAGEAAELRPLTERERAAIKWFEGLGFGDLSKTSFIRVLTGDWDVFGSSRDLGFVGLGGYWGNTGFLVSESGAELRILTPSLREVTITLDPERPAFQQRRDLRTAARALLSPPTQNRVVVVDEMHRGAQLWIMGYACLRQGHGALARELFDASVKELADQLSDNTALATVLAQEISHSVMWRAAMDIGNASIGRKELLGTFRRFLERFPESKHAARARETATLLERMVEEDEEYARRPKKPWEEMSREKKIADAIFRLRDQTGSQVSEPGACSIFLFSRGTTPADQLFAIGPPAIPALIKTIGDRRFSRANGRHRSFYFSEYTLRIEDCALQILYKITGKHFSRKRRESDEEFRARLTAWWREFETKGEKQSLMDEVASGSRDAPEVVRRLVEKYPGAAIDAIRRGVKAAETSWVRARLVDVAASLEHDSVKPFLLEQLAEGPDVKTRLAAARGVARAGESEKAVEAMIGTWRGLLANTIPAGEATVPGFRDRTAGELVRFLLQHGDARAIRALGEDLSKHTLARRVSTVRTLGSKAVSMVKERQAAQPAAPGRDEMLREIERVLITALEDTDKTSVSGSTNGVRFRDPRVCDFAAHALSTAFPDQYAFDLSAGEPQRDAAIAVLRKAAGGVER